MPDMAATMQAPDELPQGEVTYSRAAYEVFQRLDSERRALVRLAASAQPMREIAPGLSQDIVVHPQLVACLREEGNQLPHRTIRLGRGEEDIRVQEDPHPRP